jgi:hypothetical protein
MIISRAINKKERKEKKKYLGSRLSVSQAPPFIVPGLGSDGDGGGGCSLLP